MLLGGSNRLFLASPPPLKVGKVEKEGEGKKKSLLFLAVWKEEEEVKEEQNFRETNKILLFFPLLRYESWLQEGAA